MKTWNPTVELNERFHQLHENREEAFNEKNIYVEENKKRYRSNT